MHDPFQNYQLSGAYSGGVTPFGSPYAGLQNPAFQGFHPQAQGWGQIPLQGLLQNPLLQNPLLQNPLLAAYQHPLLTAGVQNPYQTVPQQQIGFYPLAPQTMIGAGNPYGGGQPYGQQFGTGQPLGQIHPLIAQQIALRSLVTAGISPWACY
jgi:hypothetical protein